ncbi:PREDICTED: L-type lectin-domain containing receptor kinase S.6 [Lupinus angustifolius]|uniref:L-type lectin-domain containing receptor kinase S.6 n=1 Tax=Lupinus angustifolius TaxID=3871 RepID=UPI00092F614A|nr:PREDICTED: L-type lectin-domain containing receptor kinase S.6 [Lupinus angustifolius]
MHCSYSLFLLWIIHFFLFTFLSSLSSSPSQNITLFGEAFFSDNNSITLTKQLPTCLSSSSSGVGRAFYVNQVRFLDPITNSTASFSCKFSFSILSSSSCPSSDGIAFLISSTTDFTTLSQGYIGLPSPPPLFTQDSSSSSSSSSSSFAVEFDTSVDNSLGDINDNHIGIDVNSVVSFATVDAISHGIDLKSGRVITAWIEYRDAIKMVRVWVSYSYSTRPSTPILASNVDLSDKFNEFMHVGFSASNGQGSSFHIVDHWQFKTFGYDSHSVSPMDMVEEGDCLLCYPGNSFTETQHNDSHSHGHRKKKNEEIALGLGGLAAFSVSAFAIVVVICVFLTKKKGKGVVGVRQIREGQSCRFQTNKVPTRLSLSEIRSATMGFNRDRLVGQGASAKVYKGSLPFGDVAVKRFERDDLKDSTLHNPFATEFATMVGCLRHKNLVQLKGWCCEGNELVLVYEFMPNGSLNEVLHGKYDDSSFALSWKQRVKIVLGVASALTYLHEECERQIIHRDVKTCNIMLDANFNSKLSDFGLAEVYEHSSYKTRDATIPAGTMGYLAPEYVYSGVPTVKTDVYSFGVVVLEVATGRKPVEDDGTVVVDYVWKLWEKKELIEGADPTLMGKFDVLEMERMLLVGLLCVHPDYEKRPTVRDAARILKKEAPIPLVPSSKPRVRIRPNCPNDTPETQTVVGDWASTDEGLYLTPRSEFY